MVIIVLKMTCQGYVDDASLPKSWELTVKFMLIPQQGIQLYKTRAGDSLSQICYVWLCSFC